MRQVGAYSREEVTRKLESCFSSPPALNTLACTVCVRALELVSGKPPTLLTWSSPPLLERILCLSHRKGGNLNMTVHYFNLSLIIQIHPGLPAFGS